MTICLGLRLRCIFVSCGRRRSRGSFTMTASMPWLSMRPRTWKPRPGRVMLITAKTTCTATLAWPVSSARAASLQTWKCPTCRRPATPTPPRSRGHHAKGTSTLRSGSRAQPPYGASTSFQQHQILNLSFTLKRNLRVRGRRTSQGWPCVRCPARRRQPWSSAWSWKAQSNKYRSCSTLRIRCRWTCRATWSASRTESIRLLSFATSSRPRTKKNRRSRNS